MTSVSVFSNGVLRQRWDDIMDVGSGTQQCFVEISTAGTVSILCATARTTGVGYSIAGISYPVD